LKRRRVEKKKRRKDSNQKKWKKSKSKRNWNHSSARGRHISPLSPSLLKTGLPSFMCNDVVWCGVVVAVALRDK